MTVQTLNAVIAGLACLLVIDKVARMDRQTCHGIRLGAVLLIPGLAAEPLSWLFPGWGAWAQTLVYAGLLCYCAADARYKPYVDGASLFSLRPYSRPTRRGREGGWIVFAMLAIAFAAAWFLLADVVTAARVR